MPPCCFRRRHTLRAMLFKSDTLAACRFHASCHAIAAYGYAATLMLPEMPALMSLR